MAEKHFYEQQRFTNSYLLPYLKENIPDFEDKKILEIGCGEAGFLDVVTGMGLQAVGLELEASRVEIARQKNPQLQILVGDISSEQDVSRFSQSFDLIIMRDVIEHVPKRDAAFANINRLLNDGGYLYITFPPRFSGFAGHQQNGKSALKYIPYLQLLPEFALKFLQKVFKEKPELIRAVLNNYDIGLTIRAFKKHYRKQNFKPVKQELFLFRPIYKIRFGVPTIKFPPVPLLQEFLAFGCEYLLMKKEK